MPKEKSRLERREVGYYSFAPERQSLITLIDGHPTPSYGVALAYHPLYYDKVRGKLGCSHIYGR